MIRRCHIKCNEIARRVHAPSGRSHRTLLWKNFVVVNGGRQTIFWSRVNCAVNHTYDVCQFKRLFSKSGKSQLVSREVKISSSFVLNAQWTTWTHSTHVTNMSANLTQKNTKTDENQDKSGVIEDCNYVNREFVSSVSHNLEQGSNYGFWWPFDWTTSLTTTSIVLFLIILMKNCNFLKLRKIIRVVHGTTQTAWKR